MQLKSPPVPLRSSHSPVVQTLLQEEITASCTYFTVTVKHPHMLAKRFAVPRESSSHLKAVKYEMI